jgi:hypothetical protein
MATVLKRKLTKDDSWEDILLAIQQLADDKSRRLMLSDDVEWFQEKAREIGRLTRILRRKVMQWE